MVPPFYGKPETMAERFFLLLFVPLSVSFGKEFRVVQNKTQLINPDGSVTISCELHDSVETWVMQGSLKWNGSTVCLPSHEHSNECAWRNSSLPHYQFTLFKPQLDSEVAYVCEFRRMIPPPVQIKQGAGTKLVSAPSQPCATAATVPQCPEPGPLNWVLMGLAGFLLLCFLAVTCAYIRLKVQQEKEMDGSLTYVPMQPPQSHTGNMRNGDPESNTTYMDMRKMQLPGRISRRDMNYNSHQMKC
ncbi:hypothetical protein ANANG_G00281660 [Anguilla anguilla]|uniref:Ig-like domain-containing protein n=2 Tax=Anguilla anguilla TaxID=7936 RepID=A0A9D3LP84_ANGAN|nr:hypothetical protein ANANG_G00281660 [Anguilla anguilla]